MGVQLDKVVVRKRLKPRRDPYWKRETAGKHLGFRIMQAGAAGTWLARYYDGDHYLYQRLGDFGLLAENERYDAAKRAAIDWWQHLEMGGTNEAVTVKAACKAYVDKLKQDNSEAAGKDAEGRFGRLIDSDPLGKVLLGKLTPRQVAEWKKRTLERGGTRGSFNRNAASVRAALNLAHERRDVASDHAWAVELKPFKDAGGRRELYLKRPARAKLLEKATPEGRRFIRTLSLLPLRPGDVAKLKVEHFNAHHKALSIPTGKTKKRVVPLANEAAAHFKECAKGKLPGAWLVSRDDGRQWNRFDWRDAINDAAAAAKLPAATCAYTLRHCVITDLIVGGLDLFHIAKISGTSIAMIEKNYGHLQPGHTRDALKEIAM